MTNGTTPLETEVSYVGDDRGAVVSFLTPTTPVAGLAGWVKSYESRDAAADDGLRIGIITPDSAGEIRRGTVLTTGLVTSRVALYNPSLLQRVGFLPYSYSGCGD